MATYSKGYLLLQIIFNIFNCVTKVRAFIYHKNIFISIFKACYMISLGKYYDLINTESDEITAVSSPDRSYLQQWHYTLYLEILS